MRAGPVPRPPPPSSNLKDLLELEEAGEKVTWPEGISPALAREILSEEEAHRKEDNPTPIMQDTEPTTFGEYDVQSGDPTFPALHTKVPRHISAKPKMQTGKRRRCITSIEEYNDITHPSTQHQHQPLVQLCLNRLSVQSSIH